MDEINILLSRMTTRILTISMGRTIEPQRRIFKIRPCDWRLHDVTATCGIDLLYYVFWYTVVQQLGGLYGPSLLFHPLKTMKILAKDWWKAFETQHCYPLPLATTISSMYCRGFQYLSSHFRKKTPQFFFTISTSKSHIKRVIKCLRHKQCEWKISLYGLGSVSLHSEKQHLDTSQVTMVILHPGRTLSW